MRAIASKIFGILLLLTLVCASLQAQSVADAAAASRSNKRSTNKTITNDDVKPTDASDSQNDDDAGASSSGAADRHETRATQIRNQVLHLKRQITATQARLDRLNQQKALRESRFSTFDDTERERYYARFKQAESLSQSEIERTLQRLDQLKTKLSESQEQARREGFGNSVYEPD